MKSEGRLDEQDLPDLVQELSRERWSGTLRLQKEDHRDRHHGRERPARLRHLLEPRLPPGTAAAATRSRHAAAARGRRPRDRARQAPGNGAGRAGHPRAEGARAGRRRADARHRAARVPVGQRQLQAGGGRARERGDQAEHQHAAADPRRPRAGRGLEPRRARLRRSAGALRRGARLRGALQPARHSTSTRRRSRGPPRRGARSRRSAASRCSTTSRSAARCGRSA